MNVLASTMSVLLTCISVRACKLRFQLLMSRMTGNVLIIRN